MEIQDYFSDDSENYGENAKDIGISLRHMQIFLERKKKTRISYKRLLNSIAIPLLPISTGMIIALHPNESNALSLADRARDLKEIRRIICVERGNLR